MSIAIRPRPAVLPSALRVPAAIAVGLATLTFAVLAARYAGTSEGGGLDRHAEFIVDAVTPSHSRPATLAIRFGDPLPVIAMAAVLAAICMALNHRMLAIVAILGPGLTGLATTVLKPLLGRTIRGAFAFPSGHTAAATGIALVVALVVLVRWQPGRVKGALLLFGLPLIAGGGMALALVANNVHYPTDSIGGFATAIAVVLGVALIADLISRRIAPRTSSG